MRALRCVLIALTALLLTTSAVLGQTERYEVETDVVSHPATGDIWVWRPAAEGEFPVVYAIHGYALNGYSWAVIAEALASRGVVVFAPDYHALDAMQDRWDRIIADLECGYRYVREIAAEHDGDLTQPVLFAGFSLGANLAVEGGLDDMEFLPDGSYTHCFTGAVRPDAIVAVGGAYDENDKFGQIDFDVSTLGASGARLTLVGGERDEPNNAQSADAAEELAAAGYEANYVEIANADHDALLGMAAVDGVAPTEPGHPAQQVVRIILDAIASARTAADP